MIVVSDTTPLNYLIFIEAIAALPTLFGRVFAPGAVIAELTDQRGAYKHEYSEADARHRGHRRSEETPRRLGVRYRW